MARPYTNARRQLRHRLVISRAAACEAWLAPCLTQDQKEAFKHRKRKEAGRSLGHASSCPSGATAHGCGLVPCRCLSRWRFTLPESWKLVGALLCAPFSVRLHAASRHAQGGQLHIVILDNPLSCPYATHTITGSVDRRPLKGRESLCRLRKLPPPSLSSLAASPCHRHHHTFTTYTKPQIRVT